MNSATVIANASAGSAQPITATRRRGSRAPKSPLTRNPSSGSTAMSVSEPISALQLVVGGEVERAAALDEHHDDRHRDSDLAGGRDVEEERHRGARERSRARG